MRKILFSFLIGLLVLTGLPVHAAQYFFIRDRLAATDCTALTDGRAYDVCTQTNDFSQYRCYPTDGLTGVCNTAAEWKALSSGWTRTSAGVYPTDLSDNVGVGTNTPLYTLDVFGSLRVTGTGSAADGIVMDNGQAFKTGITVGDTALLQAYDSTNGSYTTLGTLTAGTTPTLTLTGPVITSPTITGVIPENPRNGEFGFDSETQHAFKFGSSQAVTQYMPGIMYTSTANASVSDTTSETSLLGTGVGWVSSGVMQPLPASFFVPGKSLLVRVTGYITNTGTPTLRIRCKLGSTAVVDTTAFTTGAITGNGLFIANFILTNRSTGGSGTVFGQGVFNYATTTSAVSSITAANTTTSTINTASTNTLDVTAQWGTASSSNTIVSTNVTVEVLN